MEPSRFQDTLRRVAADPGVLRSQSTVTDAPPFLPDARETYVIETARAGGSSYIFLEVIDASGQGHRLVLPPRAVQAIYRQRDSLNTRSKKRGARRAYDTQVAKGQDPAERLRRIRQIGEE